MARYSISHGEQTRTTLSTFSGGVTASDGEEVFVRHKAIKVKGYSSLKADEEVEFSREKTDKGWSAAEVVRVEYPLSQV